VPEEKKKPAGKNKKKDDLALAKRLRENLLRRKELQRKKQNEKS